MKFLNVFFITLILIIVLSFNLLAYPVDQVSYSIRGNLDKLESLELELVNRIDNINSAGFALIHDGDKFKFQGDWQINFLKRSTYQINFGFLFPLELNDFKLGRGLGFSGENFLTGANRFYWEVSHFFDKKDSLIYEVGMRYPISRDGLLIIGVGNTYWNSDNNLRLGFKLDI